MPLPETIEIVPLAGPVSAEITVPGSKSITNRALVLAALADGPVTLEGALWSEDTQVMTAALRALGFDLEVRPDLHEPSNRTITVRGLGGVLPHGGTHDHPLELWVGNAGTVARFLAALVCLGQGVYRLDGVPRMRQRPQAALFRALRELGYCVDSPNDQLPAVVHGGGARPGTCCVSIAESSQFASALLLAARRGRWQVRVVGENAEESPYVAMTQQLISAFPHRGGAFRVEPDASSASYFWAAAALHAGRKQLQSPAPLALRIAHWPDTGWQIDQRFPACLPLPKRLSRQTDLGDSILTAMVLAPLSPHPVHFTELGRLRLQECERVHAMRTELTRCGARVQEHDDTLIIHPSRLHGAEIETYDDHRLAMCFATLGLKVPGIKIKNPACVKKTFPNFFQKLAAPPPAGLGASLLDAATGRPLSGEELFAE
jgi:3-phosphoshikimate 1-carboxyvinyltransferase